MDNRIPVLDNLSVFPANSQILHLFPVRAKWKLTSKQPVQQFLSVALVLGDKDEATPLEWHAPATFFIQIGAMGYANLRFCM